MCIVPQFEGSEGNKMKMADRKLIVELPFKQACRAFGFRILCLLGSALGMGIGITLFILTMVWPVHAIWIGAGMFVGIVVFLVLRSKKRRINQRKG